MEITFDVVGYVSLNDIYSSPHWSVRSRLKKEWRKKLLDAMLEAQDCELPELLDRFEDINVKEIHLCLRIHNRLDIDNNVMMAKFLMDLLQEPTKKTKENDIKLGLIKNDGPNIYTQLTIKSDKALPKGTGVVTLTIVENDPKLF